MADPKRLADSARLLLPSLAAALSRCLREGREPENLIREIARAGTYIEAERARG